MFPAFVFTLVLSAILSFANSRQFKSVKSEDSVNYESSKIFPPSDHFINSDEDYYVQVRVNTPLKSLKFASIPIILFIISYSIVLEINKRKQGEPVN